MEHQPPILVSHPVTGLPEPPRDCNRCPRLAGFLRDQRRAHPDWHNAPVPAFGDRDGWLLIVGLAPGLQGANRTGRPFTGDYAGDLLYATLLKFGLAQGSYGQRADDGLRLKGCLISNTVRCVPPQNKPTPEEARACRPYLEAHIAAMPNLKVMLALGQIAHQAAIKLAGGKLPKYPFGHGAIHHIHTGLVVADSYHCSRYNTNTGRLTPAMFESVFEAVLGLPR